MRLVGLTLVVGILVIVYLLVFFPIWRLLPGYRRARLRRLAKLLAGELEEGERLLAEAQALSGERQPIWLLLTDRRLLALGRGGLGGRGRRQARPTVVREVPLAQITEFRERVTPRSWPTIAVGAGMSLAGGLLTRVSDWWALLLMVGLLIFASGFVRLRYYDVSVGGQLSPYWSFTAQGLSKFLARGLARQLEGLLGLGRPQRG